MLTYNFNRVFRAKGIEKPVRFLQNAGFSSTFAARVKAGTVNRLTLELIERLCIAIGCTPNDFMEWVPDKNQNPDKKHPLFELKKADKVLELSQSLNLLPMAKLEEIERLIKEE